MGFRGTGWRWWIAGAAASFVAIAAFGVWIRLDGGGPTVVDGWWHGVALTQPGTPAYALAIGLAVVGSTMGVTVCAGVAVVLFLLRRRIRDAIAVAAAALMGVACSELVKILVARPRPPGRLTDPSGFSYSSGHSMGAAVLAVSLALVVVAMDDRSRAVARWAVFGAVAWTLAMMWSRTALGVHWLTDTVAGALLGASVAIVVRALIRPPAAVSRAPAPGAIVSAGGADD